VLQNGRIVPGVAYVAPIRLLDAEALSPAAQRALESVLDPEERARAARFVFTADRARFLLAHAALRRCLGQLLGRAAESLRFRYGPFGKPALDLGLLDQAPFHFNLSHSRAMALVAWAGAELGVDVEDVGREVDELGLGRRVFSPSEQQVLRARPAGPARRAAFYSLWTRKEAVLKGLGTGLSREAAEIDLGRLPAGHEPSTWTDTATGERWTIADVNVGPAQRAAVAIRGELSELRIIQATGA
jgi:4'-phosphopantetheinyl transferase